MDVIVDILIEWMDVSPTDFKFGYNADSHEMNSLAYKVYTYTSIYIYIDIHMCWHICDGVMSVITVDVQVKELSVGQEEYKERLVQSIKSSCTRNMYHYKEYTGRPQLYNNNHPVSTYHV